MLIIKNKANWLLLFSLIFFIASGIYVFNQQQASGLAAAGQVGGRIGPVVQAGSCGCPYEEPCPHGCSCGNFDVQIIPSGYSAIAICPPPALPTSGPPITVGSVGNQILGMFSAPAPAVAVPLGIIGTSF